MLLPEPHHFQVLRAGHSRFLPAYLNRQIISILYEKSLGVPDSAFEELQVPPPALIRHW